MNTIQTIKPISNDKYNKIIIFITAITTIAFITCEKRSDNSGSKPGPLVEMVRISGGTFTMGSPESEVNSQNNERSQRQVTLTGFYIGNYENLKAAYVSGDNMIEG